MITTLEDLLSRLENISAEAVAITDPALSELTDSVAVFEKIKERGELVQRLNATLAVAGPLSYTDFNRLIVIHHQGSRTEQNLRFSRSQLAGQLSANTRERAYLDCVTGGLETPRGTSLTNSV